MSTFRVEVSFLDHLGHLDRWTKEANEFLGVSLDSMEQVNFYKVESSILSQNELSEKIRKIGPEVFCDSIIQTIAFDNILYDFPKKPRYVVEVSYRAGVTDNPGHAAKEALSVVGLIAEVSSGSIYFLFGNINDADAKKVALDILANDLIQKVDIFEFSNFCEVDRFHNVSLPKVLIETNPSCNEISLDVSDEALLKISQDNCLALTLSEMKHIQSFYNRPEIETYRKEQKFPKWPTDVELEVLAQSWSEHCKHKIFAGSIDYKEGNIPEGFKKLGDIKIEGLYPTYIKASTKKIEKERNLNWLISVFSDNAGIVRFDGGLDLCIKVETHNSPSALDPYGGALTGILGVNRDILGCGLGARPIANTDVFCFADPKMPTLEEKDLMPRGLKAPRRIFEGVHRGVEDGGNKSGIPTVNGAIYFDQDYAGKPLVFCGTVGAMPAKLPTGLDSGKKYVKVSDRVFMVGGAIGADGIHGATFSSLELNENSPSTAVQIGDPITQKRVLDFLMEARDLGLYSSVTDNGAGGLSSSVGEMSTFTGGATIDLSLAPVKYPGLKPFELMISESQERMTVAVPPKNVSDFLSLAKRRGVSATDIGEFNDSGRLKVFYGEQKVADLDLEFVHESLPPMQLKAKWEGPVARKSWILRDNRKDIPKILDQKFYHEALLKLLSSPNIASKEPWVRKYDHEVQAATHIKPFNGVKTDGPSDCGSIWLHPHGGEKDNAVNVACGMNPRMSLYDTYLMAQFAVDEAVRNVVVSGGDIDKCCLLDNFCWPDPVASEKNKDGEYKMAQLVRACHGLFDICNYFGTPLVSGKDSMKNDFRGKNQKGTDLTISILPTLLVTSMSKSNVNFTVTSSFKEAGDLIYILGKESSGLSASEFAELYKVEEKLPQIDLSVNKNLYKTYLKALENNLICSGHDLSDGGLLVSIFESSMGGRLGFSISINQENPIDYLFNEGPGRFCVSVKSENKEKFEKHFSNVPFEFLGTVIGDQILKIKNKNSLILETSMNDLIDAWKGGLK
jgi:phosphoribosylformylglycinamidine synthase subunit PurSL